MSLELNQRRFSVLTVVHFPGNHATGTAKSRRLRLASRLIAGVTVLTLFACHGWSTEREKNLALHYSPATLRTYEAFESPIDGHVLLLAHLKSGTSFPMLCRRARGG